ncbi:MAG: hypothetical protein GY929_22005 [Actinomycetia bacterium]|nr:hypothetical protein [Actinomycetes bacterium]
MSSQPVEALISRARTGTILVVAVLLAITGLAPPALAQSEGTVADAVAANGYYVASGSEVTADETAELVAELRADGITTIGLVSLEVDPLSGAIDYAEEVANQVAGRGGIDTIVVVTPTNIGGFSTGLSDVGVQNAVDEASESFSTLGVFEGFARTAALASISDNSTTQTTATPSDNSGDSGGGGGGVLLVILLIVVAGVGLWLFMRSRRRRARATNEIEQDKAEIRAQLATSADLVLKLADQVVLADQDTQVMFEEASRAFQQVSGQLETATTALQIDELDDQIDVAEWQLQSVDARLGGRSAPEDPRVIERREQENQRRIEEQAELEQRQADQDRQTQTEADQRRREQERRRAELEQRRRNPQSQSRRGGGLGGVGAGVLGGVLGGILTGGGRGRGGGSPTTSTSSTRTAGNFDRSGPSRRTQRRRSTNPGRTSGGRGGAPRRSVGGRGGARRRTR